MLRWLLRNISALLLSLALAVTIWVVAVNEEDPFEEKVFPDPVPVTIINLPEGMMLVGDSRLTVDLRVRAPQSVWSALKLSQLRVYADLGGASGGPITVPLAAEIDNADSRITAITPSTVRLTLEQVVTRKIPVRIETTGDPATGYQMTSAEALPDIAAISGPASAADSVSELVARIDIGGARETIVENINLLPINAFGQTVSDVTLDPASVTVTLPVEQLGGYRDVAVKAVVEGQVAPGYRLTNISVSPPVVTLFSSDPSVVAGLAGFVETERLDISKASDDIEVRANLVLPDGVSLVGDQTVVVQISVAAIESSLTVQKDLEIQGLGSGLSAVPSPSTVDVILSGPLPALDSLTPESVRVVLDLLNLPPGSHQVTPKVIVLPEGVIVQTVLPSTIEVLITGPGTATPSIVGTPTPAASRTPTRGPTRAPTLPATPIPTTAPTSIPTVTP